MNAKPFGEQMNFNENISSSPENSNSRSPIGGSYEQPSPRLAGAHQWRQNYRFGRSTTAKQHTEVNEREPNRYGAESLNSARICRRYPERTHSTQVDYSQDVTSLHGLPCRVPYRPGTTNPKSLGEVHLTEKFNTSETEQLKDFGDFNTKPSENTERKQPVPPTGQTSIATRRAQLLVTPSIEVSHVFEDSDSSASSEARSSNEVTGVISTRSIVNSSSGLPDSKQRSNLDLSRKSTAQHTFGDRQQQHNLAEDMQYQASSPSSERIRNRSKLTRQPRSFQDYSSDATPAEMDDFEYFCQIAHSPVGSKSEIQSTSLDVPSRSGRYSQTLRSNSMRIHAEVDAPYVTKLDSMKSHNENDIAQAGLSQERLRNSYLKPPSRGQLRRASTEEGQIRYHSADRKPVSATLSYSLVHSNAQNLSRTPPKSIPQLPTCPVSVQNSCAPLGMPLSADAILADEPGLTYYQVQVFGSSGVGKTSLCQRLAALSGNQSVLGEFDDDLESAHFYYVTATFGEATYAVNFIDSSEENFEQNLEIRVHDSVDAFIVMYAIDDSSSYETARLILNALSPCLDIAQTIGGTSRSTTPSSVTVPNPTYLVANKTDLVRARQVSTEEGKHLATLHSVKFIEVSASLNHLIDEFLVSLVTYLRETELKGRDPRLTQERRAKSGHQFPLHPSNKSTSTTNFRIPSASKSSFSKFIKKHFTRLSDDAD